MKTYIDEHDKEVIDLLYNGFKDDEDAKLEEEEGFEENKDDDIKLQEKEDVKVFPVLKKKTYCIREFKQGFFCG